jgi:hypothetical protein
MESASDSPEEPMEALAAPACQFICPAHSCCGLVRNKILEKENRQGNTEERKEERNQEELPSTTRQNLNYCK